MKRKISICLFLLFASLLSKGQYFQEIKGVILDQQTQNPIPYASILVKNSKKGVISDLQGHFSLRCRIQDTLLLQIHHLNYQEKEMILLANEERQNLCISLIARERYLKDVIVSANLYEVAQHQLSKSAVLIPKHRLHEQMHSNVIDVLASTPGFTQVWEYHSPIILRGLNSNRILVMKDGNRRIGTFPGGYFAQDINIYDHQKIEVIKGPGSVIYGSGAISGIINLISPLPFGTKEEQVSYLSGYASNNQEFLQLLKVEHRKEKFGISVNAKYRKTDDLTYGNGENADNSDVEDQDLSIHTGYQFSKAHQFLVNASYHKGDWGKPRGFNGPEKAFTKIRNEEENLHTNCTYSYQTNAFLERIQANLYYDVGNRDYFQYKYSTTSGKLTSLDLVHYKDHYGGGRVFALFRLSENSKLNLGSDAYSFRLDNPFDFIDYYHHSQGKNEGYDGAGQENIGFFAKNDWDLSEKVRLISGIRYDFSKVLSGKNSNSINRNERREAMSGNLGFVFSPHEDKHFSLNIGRAFRMPTAEEMFTKVISCKGVKVGNPDLQPEYSWNLDAGWKGRVFEKRFTYDLALFYNQLKDFITETASADPDVDFTYQNSDAKLMGGELSLSYRFDQVLGVQNCLYTGMGAAYVYGIDETGGKDEVLFGIPPLKVTANLHYKGNIQKKYWKAYDWKLEGEFAAKQTRVPAIPAGTDGGPWGYVSSDAHLIFNFSAALQASRLLAHSKIRFIVKNILDKNYQVYGSYLPAMGRNIKLSLEIRLNRK